MSIVPHGGVSQDKSDFTRLFDLDPAHHAQADLILLAQHMSLSRDPNDPKDGADDEENPAIPAGYTYLGQFVDHDLTFDTTSDLADLNSFALATDSRTTRFDLDNVYGAGPDDQPYLYEHAADGSMTGQLLLGDALDNGVPDVARNREGRAIIGDPRNDENAIVVQLQSAFIRFHNKLAERAVSAGRKGRDAFDWAQAQTRWHYQRILLDDFLPRIINTRAPSVASLFAALRDGRAPKLRFFSAADGFARMPVEFSAAAYRLGHSMIRPGYRLNPGRIQSIFAGEAGGLRGFRTLAKDFWIDWSLMFHPTLAPGDALTDDERKANDTRNGQPKPDGRGTDAPFGRTQFSYKIDTMLVDPLRDLPTVVTDGTLPGFPNQPRLLHNLATRNLLRGAGFGLPSGEAVAGLIGAPVLEPGDITVRDPGDDNSFAPAKRIPVATLIPAFEGNTPLWVYILAEAEKKSLDQLRANPAIDPKSLSTQLGDVGGLIVAETFIGLMLADRDSVLNLPAQWRSPLTNASTFTMPEMLRAIGALN